jgi:hypothetical protein
VGRDPHQGTGGTSNVHLDIEEVKRPVGSTNCYHHV